MLKIYNTLSRELEEFKPLHGSIVTFYHCGPTVYWVQHIGNLRGATMGDLIRRSLIYLGYDVKYVRNYTDVGHLTGDNLGDADTGEDRMEKSAKREGVTPSEIAGKYIKIFEDDITALNLLPATATPRATEYVTKMIQLVEILLQKGYAYARSKAIYFDTSEFPDYTKLSGQRMAENEAGAGAGEVSDQDKKHPADFAIWFFRTGVHQTAVQWWPSPLRQPGDTPATERVEGGAGFPGWHIECSAMARDLLGETIDLHMGGVEHIPVHHTNEIAQSEAASGKPFVRYWLHNEHLTVDGKKMSKSEGTGITVADIEGKGYNAIELRYFFLGAHYRSKQNFTWEALAGARTALERLVRQLVDMEMSVGEVDAPYVARFRELISDDFNIPAALALSWELVKDDNVPTANKLATLLDFDQVFGLDLTRLIRSTAAAAEILPEVQDLLNERQQAREHKDWQRSDQIRDRLEREFHLRVLDEPQGQRVERC